MRGLGADGFDLGDGRKGSALLLHGLTGSPAEMRPVGDALAAAGFRAVCPALPGHATRPSDLGGVGAAEVRAAAEMQLEALGGGRHLVCGLSLGSLLAIGLAAHRPESVAGLAALAPPLAPAGSTRFFVEVAGRFWFPRWPAVLVSKGQSVPRPGAYGKIPLRWAREFRRLIADARADAVHVSAPALVLHGKLDESASPAGASILLGLLGSDDLRLRLFPGAGHVLPLTEASAEVCREIVRFANEVLGEGSSPPARAS